MRFLHHFIKELIIKITIFGIPISGIGLTEKDFNKITTNGSNHKVLVQSNK